jgi:hypothetical protein
LSEELAGLRLNTFVTADIVHGSPNPTVIHTNQRVVDSIDSKDTGDTNCLIRTQAMQRLQGPSMVFGDNNMVLKIANADGRVNIKGLRPVLREIESIHRAKQEGMVDYIQVASKDNLSNPLSKLPSSPLAHILGLEGIVGKSPEMEVLKQQARLKYGKESNKITVLAAIPSWTKHVSEGVVNLLQMTGLLGAQQDRPEEKNQLEERNMKNKHGIGYLAAFTSATSFGARTNKRVSKRVIFAADIDTHAPLGCIPVADTVDVEEERGVTVVSEYSEKYSQFGLPDPQSQSIEEKDAWDTLVRSNSNENWNVLRTEHIEKVLAEKKTMQIQIQTLNNQKELEELEGHQDELKVSIARDKALASIHKNKRGMNNCERDLHIRREERRRGEEKFSSRGVRFAAISGSGEYVDYEKEGQNKKRCVAPTDIVIEQLLESQRKEQKGLNNFNDVVIDLQLGNVGKRNHQGIRSGNSKQRNTKKRQQLKENREEKGTNIA